MYALNQLASGWATWLVAVTWQLAALTLLAFVCEKAFRLRSARVRYALWWFVLVAPLVLAPGRMMLARWEAVVRVAPPMVVERAVTFVRSPVSTTLTQMPERTTPTVVQVVPWWSGLDLINALALLWAVGCFALTLRLLLGHRQLRRMLVKSRPVADEGALAMLRALLAEGGVKQEVSLRLNSSVGAPVLYGMRRPTVLLPEDWVESLAPDDLRALLAHEVAHVKRRDCLANLLQRLLEIPLFFHPGAWLACRWITLAREELADAWALGRGVEASSYARSLTAAAERAQTRLSVASVGVAEGRSTLLRRVEAIIRGTSLKRLNRPLMVALVAVALVSAAAFAAVEITGSVIADRFDDPLISRLLWRPETKGSGTHIAQSIWGLEVTIDADAQDEPGSGIFRAGYISTGKLSGDFDIQVDFQLLEWPQESGVRIGLATECGSIERTSRGREFSKDPSREEYATNIGPAAVMEFWMDNVVQLAVAPERTGKLRLIRQEARETGYYFRDGHWVELGSNEVTTEDVQFALLAWGHNERFTNKKVLVAFDNFVVNSGSLILKARESTRDPDTFTAVTFRGETNSTIMPSIPQSIHLTYRITSQLPALPLEWIEQRIAAAVKDQDAGLEQRLQYYRSRAENGPEETNTGEYWGTMHGFMYTLADGYCVAYDGKKTASGAASHMVPDLIEQPSEERTGMIIAEGTLIIDDLVSYLGIYQPGKELFDKEIVLSETERLATGERRLYHLPHGRRTYALEYDEEGRVRKLTITYDKGVALVEEYQFADHATVGGVTYPRELRRQEMIFYLDGDERMVQAVNKLSVWRVTNASAGPIPNSFFALSTARPGAQIEDGRYQVPGKNEVGITYTYTDPSLSIDEASERAYQDILRQQE